MKRHAFVLALLAAACASKAPPSPAPDATTPAPSPTAATLERLPADALLWEGDVPAGVEASRILEKTGVLRRMPEPTGETVARWWPFAIDYWALRRTDLETLLAPHVGRTIRVTGHYTKTWDDGAWIHEVEPVKIVAVADPAE